MGGEHDEDWTAITSLDQLIPGDVLATAQGHRWGRGWHGGMYAGKDSEGNYWQWDCTRDQHGDGAYKRPFNYGFTYYNTVVHQMLKDSTLPTPPTPPIPPRESLTTQTEHVNITWWIPWRYSFAVEGKGRIIVSVADKPDIIDTQPEGGQKPNESATVTLGRGCYEVRIEYQEVYGLPKLGFSRWPSAPDFEAGLPPCEEAPPEEPTNTPDAPVRAFSEAMDRLDVDAALETIAPVPGYKQVVGALLRLYKGVMDGLNLDNDFSHLQYQVVSNDGQSARVLVWGPVIFRSTEDGSTVSELEDVEVEIPVSNFLVRWYIYVSPQNILPETSD